MSHQTNSHKLLQRSDPLLYHGVHRSRIVILKTVTLSLENLQGGVRAIVG